MMKSISSIRIALLGMLIFLGIGMASAVTDAEMEQARAIAAWQYLRWANDGSGYLDELKPTSMASLEKSLKAKEKENLASFKSVKTPADYASWDKARLVEYWSKDFFASPGLIEKGRGAKSRVRSKIQAMTVSVPAKQEPKEEPKAENAQGEISGPENAVPEGEVSSDAPPALTDSLAEKALAADSIAEAIAQADAGMDMLPKKKSNTWIYVVALVALIGVVVWLVIFASKTMSAQEDRKSSEESDFEPASLSMPEGKYGPVAAEQPVRRRSVAAEMPVRHEAEPIGETSAAVNPPAEEGLKEKYVRSLAEKDEEIRLLHREVLDLREECLRLGEENGRLTSDLSATRREMDALRGRLKAASALTAAASATTAPQPVNVQPQRAASPAGGQRRELFLGRVNDRGLFVRADHNPVAGKSVFVLTSHDGYTGSYTVIQDPDVLEMALNEPQVYLAGACVANDITDTASAEGINVLSAGTAVFEGGAWKVLRKAKIAYI